MGPTRDIYYKQQGILLVVLYCSYGVYLTLLYEDQNKNKCDYATVYPVQM